MAKHEPFTFNRMVKWWIASPIIVWLGTFVPPTWNPIDWVGDLIGPLPAWVEIPLALVLLLVLAIPILVFFAIIIAIPFLPIIAFGLYSAESDHPSSETERRVAGLCLALSVAIVVLNFVIIYA